MAGIYIHIPFCKQACHYCNFHFSTSLRHRDAMVDAICHEIDLQQDFLSDKILTSIYFGGGTPSMLESCQDAGINNLSLDLIYGMPHSTQESWQYNIDKAISLDVDHISSYALTVEPNTALDHMVKKGTISLPPDIVVSRQYLQLISSLTSAGYEHYEISNFAKPDKYAVHNTNYWRSIPYLGIGPSAHSYQPTFRQWNIANNAKYIESIAQGIVPSEREETAYADQFNDFQLASPIAK